MLWYGLIVVMVMVRLRNIPFILSKNVRWVLGACAHRMVKSTERKHMNSKAIMSPEEPCGFTNNDPSATCGCSWGDHPAEVLHCTVCSEVVNSEAHCARMPLATHQSHPYSPECRSLSILSSSNS